MIEASLDIGPQPSSLHFTEDAFGNQMAIARFDGCAQELSVESVVCLEQSPADASALALTSAARSFPSLRC